MKPPDSATPTRSSAPLIREGHADDAALDAIDADVRAEIEDAVRFAYDSPFPNLIELRRDVFAHELAEA